MRLALTFYSVLKMPIKDIISCAVEAENAGCEFIAFAESFYRDAAVLTAAVASKTNRVKFGSSIYPISTRTPIQIAMATATLNELSGGRVGFIGLGVGYKARIEEYFGVKLEKPIPRMKEYVKVLRGLLSGQTFSFGGEFFGAHNFPRMTSGPVKIPILFGSSAPNMLELTGEIADGVVLNSIGTPEYFREALSHISDGAREARRNWKELEIASSVIFSVADKHHDAIEVARPDVLFYLLYPELDPVIRKTGYAEHVREIRKAYAKGDDRRALAFVTDEMVDELTISGTRSECREKIKKLYDYGITLPVIRVSAQTVREEERRETFLRAVDSLSGL
jgi:5,10-methylenetetrahydromethanopterin reductase